MDNRRNVHSKGYTQGIFWPSAILPIVVLGPDNLFRLEHSGTVLRGCDGKSSDDWNWNGAQVAPFESEQSIVEKGGFIMGMDHKHFSQLDEALTAIQQPGVARELERLFPLIDRKVRACVGTLPDLEHKKTLVFTKLIKACLVHAKTPCPHRRAIAWHVMEMNKREGEQFARAAVYHFSEAREQPVLAQQFLASVEMSYAFAAGAASWTEPLRSPQEQAACLREAVAELNKLWADLLRLFEAPSPSPVP